MVTMDSGEEDTANTQFLKHQEDKNVKPIEVECATVFGKLKCGLEFFSRAQNIQWLILVVIGVILLSEVSSMMEAQNEGSSEQQQQQQQVNQTLAERAFKSMRRMASRFKRVLQLADSGKQEGLSFMIAAVSPKAMQQQQQDDAVDLVWEASGRNDSAINVTFSE